MGPHILSRHTRGLLIDAVFVFDADGSRCAGSPGVDGAFGGKPIQRLTDLAARFHQPDGMPLDLDVPGTRIALGSNGQSGSRVVITTELLGGGARVPCEPAMLISVRPFRDEDDPVTVHHALGSVLAHELRTPMTTIFGGAQLVSDPRVSETTRHEAARSVEREAQHLNRIIEDLVVLVRSNRDSPPGLEPVMLQHVVPRAVAATKATRPRAQIEVSLPPSLPPVMAAEEQVDHVVHNLVDHAVVYSPPGSTVRVDARRSGRNVEVHILDDGPVRDAAGAKAAFDLFHTSARSAADPSGANLGLVVTRRLVLAMGGRLWASSSGPGGELVFSLPIAGRP
jgi:histidine kinase/DNA gyrase B/HSP90-like ATPase/phospho-acceptor domain-containing protein